MPKEITKKVCCSCKIEKFITEYYKSNVRYYQTECKNCNKIRRSKWWKSEAGRLSSANTKLKSRFGITLAEYDELVVKVGGSCEICSAKCSANGHRLAVDHSHTTGKIRGILCKACNVGLGQFQDKPELLRLAASYLESKSNC